MQIPLSAQSGHSSLAQRTCAIPPYMTKGDVCRWSRDNRRNCQSPDRLLYVLAMKKRKSPCIDVCEFTGPNGWCLGCGRTREECARWKKMKPYEANSIEKELKRRMAKMIQALPKLQ